MSRSGTCPTCKTEQLLERGKLVEHQAVAGKYSAKIIEGGVERFSHSRNISVRCLGSLTSSAEDREKHRTKARDKRRATVLAVRDEASVLVDMLLTKRHAEAAEWTEERRAELLKLALVGYRLEHANARGIENGIFWWTGSIGKGVRAHKLFCRFCGFLVVQFPIGRWSKLTDEERRLAQGTHVFTCALQFLAGIRKAPEPGTMLDAYDGPMFDGALAKRCPACGAAAGTACVDIETELYTFEHVTDSGAARFLDRPHEARLS